MRFQIKTLALSMLCCTVLLSGCEKQETSAPSEIEGSDIEKNEEISLFPVHICDVDIKKAAERVVSLSPAATEIICELGFADRLVGISNYCDNPAITSAVKVGSSENPDLETIMKLNPDVLITISPLSEREAYLLEQAKITVLSVPVPVKIEGYSELYSDISAVFYGKETVDERGAMKYSVIGRDARKKLETAAAAVKLEKFIYVTGKLTIAGADTFESAVLSLAGENICGGSGYVASSELSEESSPVYVVADNTLTLDKLRSDEVLNGFLEQGAKVRFVTSRCFERPTARTAEVFAEIAAGATT